MDILFFRPISFLLGLVGLNAYIFPVPLSKWMRLMPNPPVSYGMLQYYGKGAPGDCPNWKNKINMSKLGNFGLRYNPFDYTSKYKDKPFFMAYADGGYSPELLQKFYDDIHVKDKDLFTGKNATHFDLYYNQNMSIRS